MSNKIVSVSKSIKIANELHRYGKSIVLVGGVFDILHVGHVRFLEKAKETGDNLFLLLESDESVRKLKGKGRPLNSQKNRAEVLKALRSIDYVVLLSGILKDKDYDRIVFQIKPNILATTKNDPNKIHKVRQAKKIGAKAVYVIEKIKNKSTTEILNYL